MSSEELPAGTKVDYVANAEHRVGEVLALPAESAGVRVHRVSDARTGEEFLLERKDILS
ncbi:Uncharacterised protein (plasmid) [Tsukamurella tyrosinosolvens]|uniref:Uncharacterized protein n=1 Tax=Tsukamurella tyrosinosolvens TaxID=57704 RepID=A0A1H4V766_TSUTY|nr:hypothetical protein [Tsukamurella tyrosinosolvens]SEC76929.1 hypothetical protein SAMN04489793_3166 [Tsukamurella tyrosinosolvens]VEH90640.1 Uncharacterised protein [Tsukamurella tyrosinosolvens]